jgi:hypothetical protein
MASEIIGSVKSGKSHKLYEVKWDPSNRDIYVYCSGWTSVGQANSAREAMTKAEAYLYNK